MFDGLNELSDKIYLGEDSTIEFKQSLSSQGRSNFADEIAAFANARKSGVILIGVSDDSDIIGIPHDDLNAHEKLVTEICQDSIKPAVQIFTEKLKIDGKAILKIEIPYSLFVHKSPGGYFIRQGSSKREMSTEQLARLMQSRSQARIISFDEQVVPNTQKTSLNENLYQRFINQSENQDDVENLLFKRRLLIKENGNYRVSVAGVLMCSVQPDKYIYNSFICAVQYSGKTKDANYQLDAKDFKGPLDEQIIDAFEFVRKNTKVAARKEIGREETPQYSMKAVFEALVNAVVHRDYSKHGSKIRLFMFADRLEIYSPGALANTLTVENLPFNQVTRNELVAGLLSEIDLPDSVGTRVGRIYFLERRGEGVGIILNESRALSGKQPVYKMYGEELCLTIFAAERPQ